MEQRAWELAGRAVEAVQMEDVRMEPGQMGTVKLEPARMGAGWTGTGRPEIGREKRL